MLWETRTQEIRRSLWVDAVGSRESQDVVRWHAAVFVESDVYLEIGLRSKEVVVLVVRHSGKPSCARAHLS